MSYIVHVIRLVIANPVRGFWTTLRFFSEFAMDRRIGVSTLRREFRAHPSMTGDSHPCQPVPYVVLEGLHRFILENRLPLTTFLDIGCGVGRPLAYLSKLPFERMTGVEINPDVAALARRNATRIHTAWRKARAIQVLTGDALTLPLEFTGGIVYLANPFGPETMRALAAQIRLQLLAHPGLEAHLIYAHPHFTDVLEAAFPRAAKQVIEGLQACHYFRLSAASLEERSA
ncbi:MAG: class I SAM-dependent methyltransferase [Acidobacteria bacterium]|nr:class I SAM-dependent methyltransferase [Acidobacteriota bacterium]